MNKLGQFDLEPVPLLIGAVGAIVGWIMAGKMKYGFIVSVIIAALMGVVNYFVALKISES